MLNEDLEDLRKQILGKDKVCYFSLVFPQKSDLSITNVRISRARMFVYVVILAAIFIDIVEA